MSVCVCASACVKRKVICMCVCTCLVLNLTLCCFLFFIHFFTEFTNNNVISIINYNISMPKCDYSINSRRKQDLDSTLAPTTNPTMTTMAPMSKVKTIGSNIRLQLEQLNGWNDFSEIAIDGQNGTTKSSISKTLNRKYLKINEIFPRVSCGSDYNHRPLKSIDYMFIQLAIKSENSIWDRCVYSNLIFYYIHHLMYKFANTSIPNDDSIVWPILNNMALDTGLLDTLAYTQSKKSIPTIFLVCSNVDLIGESLRYRGIHTYSVNDIWNSKEYNYQMAQYHVYRWFGKILNYPTFDIVDFFTDGLTVDDIHILISSKINTPQKNENDDNLKYIPDVKKYDEFEDIISMYNDDILIFEHSRK
ncbi:guanosine monophosphate kinase [Mauternbach virus]|uniref:Guanosine monophosphate kinase n=1 Tax=Mauternbach virus TaxID=2486603 RepID=A0A3G3E635_9VIRU|nr:guanosine monophosphate kinase [Mauternbach virus]AYP97932.1 guanosine monophosphate kinase [Mauternbach virus]